MIIPMIRPHLLLLVPLFPSAFVAQTRAEIIQLTAGASEQGGLSDRDIVEALRKPAVPNPIPVDTTKEDANITAADFRHFAPLYEALKGSPSTARELEFFIRHRGRIIGTGDRRVGMGEMQQEFKKLFPDIRAVPAPLRIGVAAAWTRGISAHRTPDPFVDALFTESDKDSPIVRALLLAEKLRYAQHSRAESLGKGRMDTIMDCHRRLRETVDSIGPEGLAKFSDETLLAVLSPLFNEVEKESLKNPAYTLVEGEVIKSFESLPEDARRAPHETIVARYYEARAWFRRGGSWANETDAQRLADFESLLAQSGRHYRAALAKNPNFLPAAQGLLRIAGSDPDAADGDENHWYALCEKIEPNNEKSARAYIFASRPRWGKPPSNLLNFAARAVREERYDTPMPLLAVEALGTLLEDDDGEALKALHAKTTLTVFNRYLDDQAARKPRVVDANGKQLMAYQKMHAVTHLSKTRAGLAYVPQLHRESVDPAREKVVDHLIARHLKNLNKPNPAKAPGRLLEAAMNSTLSDEDAIRRFNDRAKMTAWLKQAEADAKQYTDINNASCFERYLPRLREAVDFIDGKTVTLGVGGKDSFHATSAQDWRYGKGFFVAKDQGAPSSLFGSLLGWFKPPYEITLRMRENALRPGSWAGLHFGRTYTGTTGRSFVLNQQSGDWRILAGQAKDADAGAKAAGKARSVTDTAIMTVRVLPHGYTLLLNGVVLHSGQDDGFRPGVISVGTLPLMPTTGNITFENPVLRALKRDELTPDEASWMDPETDASFEEFFGKGV